MNLDDLPIDVWRLISIYLTKSDLIALQFVNQKLLKLLDTTPDIWWGKHNSDYQKHWNAFYNDIPKTKRDRKLEKLSREYNRSLIKQCQGKYECYRGPGTSIIKGLFASHVDVINKCPLQEKMRLGGQDLLIIHARGVCFQCDYG